MNHIARRLAYILILMIGWGAFTIGLNAADLIWDEPFNDNRNSWYEDSRMVVQNGRYEFFSQGNDAYSRRSTPMRDGVIQVDTEWLGERDTHGYGIIFRLEDPDNFYFFWLAAQGYWIVGKAEGGSASVLHSWTFSEAVQPHGRNTMRVGMTGSQFSCYLNGTRVFQFQDTTFPSGEFGFYTQQGVYAAFDNATVWEGQPENVGLAGTAETADDAAAGEPISWSQSAMDWRGENGTRKILQLGGSTQPVWGTDRRAGRSHSAGCSCTESVCCSGLILLCPFQRLYNLPAPAAELLVQQRIFGRQPVPAGIHQRRSLRTADLSHADTDSRRLHVC